MRELTHELVGVRRKLGELKRMQCLGVVLAFISLISGVVSAYYWYRSSRIKISPAWEPDIDGDPGKNVMAWVPGNMIALTQSGRSNRSAALWATLAAVAAAATSAVSIFSK